MLSNNEVIEILTFLVQAKGTASKILHHEISSKGEGGWQNMTVDQ